MLISRTRTLAFYLLLVVLVVTSSGNSHANRSTSRGSKGYSKAERLTYRVKALELSGVHFQLEPSRETDAWNVLEGKNGLDQLFGVKWRDRVNAIIEAQRQAAYEQDLEIRLHEPDGRVLHWPEGNRIEAMEALICEILFAQNDGQAYEASRMTVLELLQKERVLETPISDSEMLYVLAAFYETASEYHRQRILRQGRAANVKVFSPESASDSRLSSNPTREFRWLPPEQKAQLAAIANLSKSLSSKKSENELPAWCIWFQNGFMILCGFSVVLGIIAFFVEKTHTPEPGELNNNADWFVTPNGTACGSLCSAVDQASREPRPVNCDSPNLELPSESVANGDDLNDISTAA